MQEYYQNSSTNLHRSTSSNPTTSRSQLPFQRNSAIRLLASSVIPTTRSTNVSSIPTASNKSSQSNSEQNTPASSSIPSCHLGMAKVNTWASGGITCQYNARKSNTGLSTQLWVLGKKNNDCITIETEGWINAHRLIFNTLNRAEHEDLKADIQPITIRVNEKNIIGEGSMQRAFKAEVKTICSDGSAIITNHVAKIQYHEKYQTIAHHATDALMYEASGLLLSKFKCLISESSRVEHQYKKIANTLQSERRRDTEFQQLLVAVLLLFLGGSAQWSLSNVDFNIQGNEPGIDLRTYWLMNALSHWTYVQSNGKSLLCDLQGVGPILTNPQILDTDPTRWLMEITAKKESQSLSSSTPATKFVKHCNFNHLENSYLEINPISHLVANPHDYLLLLDPTILSGNIALRKAYSRFH
ncbi:hypothetical protein PSHT_13760 [Puccinia striiformis]|uniref:Alpha-type protein kinase domain-containing protein n=1 Tax=Puccinia striiformis TaxID=27350 RepID=A0A2S4UNU6_9BASI|nr:hypothetical protein PSHT_13760 [Puccinia striiformis]